jgi:site-specific recombinase XerD
MRETKKPQRRPGRPATIDEVRRLLAATGKGPAGLRNAAFISVCYGSGLRCAEALSLMPRDIDRRPDGGILLRVLCGKGNKSRTVALVPEFFGPIQRWIDQRRSHGITDRSPLICGITTSAKKNVMGGSRHTLGRPVTHESMRLTIARLAAKAGINQRIHIHGFRHGHATVLAESGVELRAISAQLGHSNFSTTDRYLSKINPAGLIDAVSMVGTVGHS